MSATDFPVLFFTEGDYYGVYFAGSEAEANAFIAGLGQGALLYGAGSCNGYLIPIDGPDMREYESAREVERAMIDLADKQERHRLAKSDAEP